LIRFDILSWLYPAFNRCMIWSAELDCEHRVWTPFDDLIKRKEKEKP